MITVTQYIDAERTLRTVAGALGVIGDRQVKSDLQTCELVLSIVRKYAVLFNDGPTTDADRVRLLEYLYQDLYV